MWQWQVPKALQVSDSIKYVFFVIDFEAKLAIVFVRPWLFVRLHDTYRKMSLDLVLR
jgi:hypothetical protein